jgi:two-component system, OmpR family, response regulator
VAHELVRADGSPIRVLIVNNELGVTEALAAAMRQEGLLVRGAATGVDAVAIARQFQPDAVVFDALLHDVDGFPTLRELRIARPGLRVLFLTDRDAAEVRMAGLTARGDDYVTKPFSLEEVLARLRSILRRAELRRQLADQQLLVVGDLVMNEDAYEVFQGGRQIELSRREYDLLRYFMCNPRRVLSRRQILDRVWSYGFGGRDHVVELYVSYLRRKLDDGRPSPIQTVRGIGYVLSPN